ncbi:MAG TPA: glycoside hydrolase family 32 protein [Saprospiraceae bacterium]|nr:glycoside hydrolase family 32 protein [Saprospiraceae bacterium]
MKKRLFYICCMMITSWAGLGSCKKEAIHRPYQERYRPQFHFSPPAHWMNDPNGLVWYDGEYHLFYQYYPDSMVWGPMHWGHAITKDLVHWEHLPIALYPDTLGYIFSGSAVTDWNNSSGLQAEARPPIVAMYTVHNAKAARAGRTDYQSQCIAFSNDGGRTFNKYGGNPVLPNPGTIDFRDPHLLWDKDIHKWILALAVGNRINFYSSPDLIKWTYLSEFGSDAGSHGGVWECPDLFRLPIGDSFKWVLVVSINPGGPNAGSATQYFIGDFDGKQFKNDNPKETSLWLDYGPDNYAGSSWSDIPEADGRRIFISWMNNWNYGQKVPTQPWRSAMTIPRELQLRSTPEGIRLVSRPVKELEQLRQTKMDVDFLKDSSYLISGLNELIMSFDLSKGNADEFGVAFSNAKNEKVVVGLDIKNNHFYIDRSRSGRLDFSDQFTGVAVAPRISTDNTVTFHLFLDRASVELFGDDGLVAMTSTFFPNENFNRVTLFQRHGKAVVSGAELYELGSAW